MIVATSAGCSACSPFKYPHQQIEIYFLRMRLLHRIGDGLQPFEWIIRRFAKKPPKFICHVLATANEARQT